jgi:cytochrome c553
VNDGRWVDENHGDFYARNKDGCKACHGPNLLGTVLAAMPIGRTFSVEGRQISYAKGELVACNRCHGRPSL